MYAVVQKRKKTIIYPFYIHTVYTIYNMSGRVVSEIQTRAEGESLYIRYNTDANDEKRLITTNDDTTRTRMTRKTTHLMSSLAK